MGQAAVETIDLTCPLNPMMLLGRIRAAGMPITITTDNLIELSCRDCRYKVAKRHSDGKKPRMVLHRYNLLGDLVESQTIW